MTLASRPQVLVAGIGNIFFGDDGFGPEVARRLERRTLPDGVRVRDSGIAGLHLAHEIADGVDLLVLVDTVDGEGPPGEVVVVEIDGDLPAANLDAHGMDPTAVLASVRHLGGTLPRTVVVGCRPADLGEHMGLSPVVAAAVGPAADAVVGLVSRFLTTEPTGGHDR